MEMFDFHQRKCFVSPDKALCQTMKEAGCTVTHAQTYERWARIDGLRAPGGGPGSRCLKMGVENTVTFEPI